MSKKFQRKHVFLAQSTKGISLVIGGFDSNSFGTENVNIFTYFLSQSDVWIIFNPIYLPIVCDNSMLL